MLVTPTFILPLFKGFLFIIFKCYNSKHLIYISVYLIFHGIALILSIRQRLLFFLVILYTFLEAVFLLFLSCHMIRSSSLSIYIIIALILQNNMEKTLFGYDFQNWASFFKGKDSTENIFNSLKT